MSEQRKVHRQFSGRLYYNNRNSIAECVVHDISRHGALLEFSDELTIPDTVDLYIPQKNQTCRAHIVWRHANKVGIAFAISDQTEGRPESVDLAGRVEKMEREIELLKRALKRFKLEASAADTKAA